MMLSLILGHVLILISSFGIFPGILLTLEPWNTFFLLDNFLFFFLFAFVNCDLLCPEEFVDNNEDELDDIELEEDK